RVRDAPNKVFPNAIALVGMELVVQIVADAAGRNLGNQLGWSGNVLAIIPRLSAILRRDTKKGVRLRFVFQVEADGSVVTTLHPRRGDAIKAQKSDDIEMWAGVIDSNGRRHMHNPFNQFCFLD